MKREILFRGKDIRYIPGEWVYFGIENDEVVDPATVGQYIGQTDRDGTKIFEGDIVEFDPKDSPFGEENPFYNPENRDVIFWDDHTCKFDAHLVLLDDDNCSRMKVIGNIHDNPEMI
jgi:uncharacterized phage protein (TIGR01671 family)